MHKLTKEQGAILTAYTGIVCCDLDDFHEYVENLMGRSFMSHEFTSKKLWEEIKEKSKSDFLAIMPSKV